MWQHGSLHHRLPIRKRCTLLIGPTRRGFLSTYGTYQSYCETTLLRGHTTGEIAWVGTIEGVLLILCGVVAGPIYDRGHVRALLVAGPLLTVGGVMALSAAYTYSQVLLAQGVCVGLGSGLLYLPSISLVAAAFHRPGPRTLAAGIATSGAAVGGIVYPIVLERLLPAVGFGWATRLLGLITLAELVAALLIIRTPGSGTALLRRTRPQRPVRCWTRRRSETWPL
jgi:MFS family permease